MFEIQYSSIMGYRNSCFENRFRTDSINVTVNHMSYICGNKQSYKWRGSGLFC